VAEVIQEYGEVRLRRWLFVRGKKVRLDDKSEVTLLEIAFPNDKIRKGEKWSSITIWQPSERNLARFVNILRSMSKSEFLTEPKNENEA